MLGPVDLLNNVYFHMLFTIKELDNVLSLRMVVFAKECKRKGKQTRKYSS